MTRVCTLHTRRTVLMRGLALGLAAPLVAACAVTEAEFSWFQKLTVTIDTPDGPKTGAAVIRFYIRFYKSGTSAGADASIDITGEGGAIEVFPGKYLFVLLNDFDNEVAETMFISKSADDDYETNRTKRFATLQSFGATTRTSELLPSFYPTCVTFRDMSDPSTLVIVDLEKLDEHFGLGVKLRNVQLTVSPREAVPDKIQTLLPWLVPDAAKRGRIIPTKKVYLIDKTPAELITFSDFVTFDRWKRG